MAGKSGMEFQAPQSAINDLCKHTRWWTTAQPSSPSGPCGNTSKWEKKCWTWGQIIFGYPNSRISHVLFLRIHLHVQPKLLHLTSKPVHKIPWQTCLTSTQIEYPLTDHLYFTELFFFLNYRSNFSNHFNNFTSPGNCKAVIHLLLEVFRHQEELAVAK